MHTLYIPTYYPLPPSRLGSCLCRDTLNSFDSTVELLILCRVSAGLLSAQYPRFRDLLINPTLGVGKGRDRHGCVQLVERGDYLEEVRTSPLKGLKGGGGGRRVPWPLCVSLFCTHFFMKHCQAAQRHNKHHVFTSTLFKS